MIGSEKNWKLCLYKTHNQTLLHFCHDLQWQTHNIVCYIHFKATLHINHEFRQAVRTIQPAIQWVLWDLSQGIQRPGPQNDEQHSSKAQTETLYDFIAGRISKHMNILIKQAFFNTFGDMTSFGSVLTDITYMVTTLYSCSLHSYKSMNVNSSI